MSLRRATLCVCVLAVGALGLSSCGGEKPSGLPLHTAGATSSSSPSPTSTSKWSPEQQKAINGYDEFTKYVSRVWTKAEKIDMVKARRVAEGSFATTYLKGIDAGLSAGFVREGKVVNTILAVTLSGDKATIKTCLDATHTRLVNPNPKTPPYQVQPPVLGIVTLTRQGSSWLVAGLKPGGGTCVSG